MEGRALVVVLTILWIPVACSNAVFGQNLVGNVKVRALALLSRTWGAVVWRAELAGWLRWGSLWPDLHPNRNLRTLISWNRAFSGYLHRCQLWHLYRSSCDSQRCTAIRAILWFFKFQIVKYFEWNLNSNSNSIQSFFENKSTKPLNKLAKIGKNDRMFSTNYS